MKRYRTPNLSVSRIVLFAACLIGAGVTLFTAAAVQQDERQSANDPQVQLAEDAATRLSAGASPQSVLPAPATVDMHASLAPFVIVVNNDLHVLATSGKLNGRTVMPPAGTFTPDHRFTWQPDAKTRLAAVVERYNGGYVVAARNLREVEHREDSLRTTALLALVGIAAVGLAAFAILAP